MPIYHVNMRHDMLKETKSNLRRKKIRKSNRENSISIVSTMSELELALSSKKAKRIVLAGELVTISMNPLSQETGVVQPNRYAEHSLLSQGRSLIYASIPSVVVDAIKQFGKKNCGVDLALDKVLRWMYTHSAKVGSFRMILAYPSAYSTVIEIYTVTDKSVRSYDLRQIPGSLKDAISTVQSDSPLPIWYATTELSHEPYIADNINYCGSDPFYVSVSKSISLGDERNWLDWLAPACAVVMGLMSYWVVNYYQNSQLNYKKSEFRNIISGVEDVYFGGGRDISLLQRQQYYLEDSGSLRHHDMVSRIISAVASLRTEPRFRRVTLEHILLPSFSNGFEFDVVLKNQRGNGSVTMQTSSLVEALSKTGGLMVVTQRPAQDELIGDEPFLIYSLSIRRQSNVK